MPDSEERCGLDHLWQDHAIGDVIDISNTPTGAMDAGPCFPGTLTHRNGEIVPSHTGTPLEDISRYFVWLGPIADYPEGETFSPSPDPAVNEFVVRVQAQLGIMIIPDVEPTHQ